MSAKHTQGPVHLSAGNVIGIGNPENWERLKIHSPWVEDAHEGDAEADENMRRLVACWNAFDGIPTEDVEQYASVDRGIMRLVVLADDYRIERDELLAAADRVIAQCIRLGSQYGTDGHAHNESIAGLSAAIAKVKGGAA